MQTEKLVTIFFQRRFPDKDIEFEKKVGYFQEWVKRFETGEPEIYMDEESLSVFDKMVSEGLLE